MSALSGKVALVTGASRGIGKGIALALAAEGATIYVTGRTVIPGSDPQRDLPGTVGETAAECGRRGGRGIAVRVDHGIDEEIAALFERIKAEQGRLDVLVNNAFQLSSDVSQQEPFWKKPLSNWEMVDVGVRSSFVAAWHAAQIMTQQKSGLIVAISGYTGVTYTLGVVFGTGKSAVDRMARDMGIELKSYNVASVSLWQGPTLTERALRFQKANSALAATIRRPQDSSTAEFPGRVIAAMMLDGDIMRKTGGTFITAELALGYGVTDVDGNRVPSLREQRGAPIWQPV
jgi:NAD(P)-dependent dehydrogenase (short-subunit alcohol dehydrogenase family)